MIATTHAALWKSWSAKLSSILIIVVAMAPQLAPLELAAWFHEQFPGLPSWASWGIAVLIFVARFKASTAVAVPVPTVDDEVEARR